MPVPNLHPVVTTEHELESIATRLSTREIGPTTLALDIESDGMFAYRPRICVVQIASGSDVFVVDGLAVSLAPLSRLLADGPVKIVHDVAFDARMLAEVGIELANVRDTSIAARMLGRTATGLSSLLAELGITVDKKMQKHDWSTRPLDDGALAYLAGDVAHLAQLAATLWSELEKKAIANAVEEETRYRIAQAIVGARTPDERQPWTRLKGLERTPPEQIPILRRIANVREAHARERGVPPFKVFDPSVLFAIARAAPKSRSELAAIAPHVGRSARLVEELLRAVAEGVAEGGPSDLDRAFLSPPKLPPAEVRVRRERERRIMQWRKVEAAKREVDEQVVLPGHCVKDLLGADPTLESVSAVPGIGAFRLERDGEALVNLLTEPAGGSA